MNLVLSIFGVVCVFPVLGRVKTTEKVKKSPPPAIDDFIVDDSEGEEEGNHEEDDEREACDDDVISDDNDENDARVFYYQVDNKREEQNVDAFSNRLEKALNFSLTSDSSDDDFQKVLPKRKDIPKKSGKVTFPSEDGICLELIKDNSIRTEAVYN